MDSPTLYGREPYSPFWPFFHFVNPVLTLDTDSWSRFYTERLGKKKNNIIKLRILSPFCLGIFNQGIPC
jgi:hypothetical protein